MASQKDKRRAITSVATAVNILAQAQELLTALGRAVIVLKRVQKRHDILFAELKKCGVLKKDAK